MKSQQELYIALNSIKDNLDALERDPAKGADDDAALDILASVASINDDLIMLLGSLIYEAQFKDFKQHLDNCMRKADTCEECMEAFYNESWTITFSGKSIEIGNEAVIYQGIYNVIEALIEEYDY